MAIKKSKKSKGKDKSEKKTSNESWATKFRPQVLDDVYGQPEAVKQLQGMIDARSVPSAILFTGPSGVGKTTLSRVLARTINGVAPNGVINDYQEANFGDQRGIDDVRGLIRSMNFAPQKGAMRIICIDEFHSAATKASYNAILKPLEEPPANSLWIMATDQPERLPPAILGRCQKINLKSPDFKDTARLLLSVCKKEDVVDLFDEPKKQLIKISELCAGQPREALQCLQAVVRSMKTGGTFQEGVVSALKATEAGEAQVSIIVNMLIGLYTRDVKILMPALTRIENFHAALPKALELNKYFLDRMGGIDTYKSADRVMLIKQAKETVENMSDHFIYLRAHKQIVDLRERMNSYTVEPFHMAVAILAGDITSK